MIRCLVLCLLCLFVKLRGVTDSVDFGEQLIEFAAEIIVDELDITDLDEVNKRRTEGCQLSSPELGITFMSCNHPRALQKNFKRIIRHLNTVEPWLCYELHWIDQTTPNRDKYAKAYNFNKRILLSKNERYEFSISHAFSMCETPYMFVIEDDLELRPDINWPFISHALEVLKRLPESVYGLVLRPISYERFLHEYDASTMHAQMKASVVNETTPKWFSGGVLFRMEHMRKIFDRLVNINTEEHLLKKIGELGFNLAVLDRQDATPSESRSMVSFFNHHEELAQCNSGESYS